MTAFVLISSFSRDRQAGLTPRTGELCELHLSPPISGRRPRPRAQGVQRHNEAPAFGRRLRSAGAWPNAQNDRQFVLARDDYRVRNQRIEVGRLAQTLEGFL